MEAVHRWCSSLSTKTGHFQAEKRTASLKIGRYQSNSALYANRGNALYWKKILPQWRDGRVRLIAHDSKSCMPKGIGGSNPPLSAIYSYRGRQGADVAMLMRRLKARIGAPEHRSVSARLPQNVRAKSVMGLLLISGANYSPASSLWRLDGWACLLMVAISIRSQ